MPPPSPCNVAVYVLVSPQISLLLVHILVYYAEECLLPCNVAGCVVVRTDKTEYMVMQVRGWGPRAGNLATWKNNTNTVPLISFI